MPEPRVEPTEPLPKCDHAHATPEPAPAALERAARLFRAMGDGPRLRLLDLLGRREWCVGELAASVGEKLPAVSQRLKLLRLEGLIDRRRDGNHVYYRLADRHVADLLQNALAHADELESGVAHASDEAGEDQ